VIGLALLACEGDPPGDGDPTATSTPPDPPSLVDVVVEGGEGSGRHLPGSTVRVVATLDPTSAIVTGWHATPPIELPLEWNGTIEVPEGGVTLGPDVTAVDVALEERTWTVAAGQRTVRLAAQAEPAGVVMFFHGASYSTAQLDEPAPRSVLLHLVHAGFTVVAVPSEAEVRAGTGGWDASGGSVDHATVAALWEHLAADGLAPPTAPRIAWGMSSGGQFAHAVGAALGLDAVVAYCAPGAATDLRDTRAATGWYLAAEDTTFPTAEADARAAQVALAGRGVSTDLYVHPVTPVTPLRFTRIPGIDEPRSRALAAALLDRGLAGEDGLLTVSGAEAGRAVADLLAGDPAPVRTGILAEIEILGADHELYDDAAARMVAFLRSAAR
jgi:hypothetical protein